MAYKKIMCANESCPKHTEYSGGEFNYSVERRAFFCKDCFHSAPPILSDCADRWNFTTTHFNGERIEVRGKAHLQQLEKQFGVSNHALNYDHKNWNTPPPVKPHPVDRELMSRLDGRNY
jgi:hypothetical protein